jgi:hypothetical protein
MLRCGLPNQRSLATRILSAQNYSSGRRRASQSLRGSRRSLGQFLAKSPFAKTYRRGASHAALRRPGPERQRAPREHFLPRVGPPASLTRRSQPPEGSAGVAPDWRCEPKSDPSRCSARSCRIPVIERMTTHPNITQVIPLNARPQVESQTRYASPVCSRPISLV